VQGSLVVYEIAGPTTRLSLVTWSAGSLLGPGGVLRFCSDSIGLISGTFCSSSRNSASTPNAPSLDTRLISGRKWPRKNHKMMTAASDPDVKTVIRPWNMSLDVMFQNRSDGVAKDVAALVSE